MLPGKRRKRRPIIEVEAVRVNRAVASSSRRERIAGELAMQSRGAADPRHDGNNGLGPGRRGQMRDKVGQESRLRRFEPGGGRATLIAPPENRGASRRFGCVGQTADLRPWIAVFSWKCRNFARSSPLTSVRRTGNTTTEKREGQNNAGRKTKKTALDERRSPPVVCPAPGHAFCPPLRGCTVTPPDSNLA